MRRLVVLLWLLAILVLFAILAFCAPRGLAQEPVRTPILCLYADGTWDNCASPAPSSAPLPTVQPTPTPYPTLYATQEIAPTAAPACYLHLTEAPWRANVRVCGDLDCAVLGVISNGARVEITGKAGDWYEIKGGLWIYAALVRCVN